MSEDIDVNGMTMDSIAKAMGIKQKPDSHYKGMGTEEMEGFISGLEVKSIELVERLMKMAPVRDEMYKAFQAMEAKKAVIDAKVDTAVNQLNLLVAEGLDEAAISETREKLIAMEKERLSAIQSLTKLTQELTKHNEKCSELSINGVHIMTEIEGLKRQITKRKDEALAVFIHQPNLKQ